MDTNSVISFIRISRSYPNLIHDRKGFQKIVNKLAAEAYKVRKRKIQIDISKQNVEIMECFDKFNDFLKDNEKDLAKMMLNGEDSEIDIMRDKIVQIFFPEMEGKIEAEPYNKCERIRWYDNERNVMMERVITYDEEGAVMSDDSYPVDENGEEQC